MIIVSCLLAWGEAWFLDCRVIPQEKNAQRFYRLIMVKKMENDHLLSLYECIKKNIPKKDSIILLKMFTICMAFENECQNFVF